MNELTEAFQKNSVSDFTRDEFLAYIAAIFSGEFDSEEECNAQILHFKKIVAPDPRSSDLIYWPEEGVEDTPEGVVEQVEKFRRENGLPGFRDEASPEPDTAK